ncbi:MAG: hypothetical protein ACI8S3_001886 [Alphaproteobacteria bacterium]
MGRLRDVSGTFELPIALLAGLVLVFTLPALGLPTVRGNKPG